MVRISEVAKDLPLLAGLMLLLVGTVFAVSQIGLPGIGYFDNPVNLPSDTSGDETVKYDLSTQFTLSASALGELQTGGFTYQTTKSCTFCLSTLSGDELALGGVNAVRVDYTVTNTGSGRVVTDVVKRVGEIGAGQSKVVEFTSNNLQPGTYKVKYRIVFNPEVYNIGDDEKIRSFNVEVPKVNN